MSREHKCEVVIVDGLSTHPNADNLMITRVFGYQCIVRKHEIVSGDACVFIPPESLVPLDHVAFEFLRNPDHPERTVARVGAKRLRKEWSEGLLIPARQFNLGVDDAGTDVAGVLGVTHYEPPEPPSGPLTSGKLTKKPPGFPIRTYDVEALRRYRNLLIPGEQVMVTEKIHGSQARFTFRDGVFHVGSKGVWRAGDGLHPALRWMRRVPLLRNLVRCVVPAPTDAWTRVLAESKQLQDFLREHPGWVVYGEIYGSGIQKNYTYGCAEGERKMVVFDIKVLADDKQSYRWLNVEERKAWCLERGLPTVPELYRGPYSRVIADEYTKGASVLAPSQKVREGVVIRDPNETVCYYGKKIFKLLSEDYLADPTNSDGH